MLPLTKALEVYNNVSPNRRLLEYRNFLLDQIKLLFKSNSNNQNEVLLYLPDYVKNHIVSKISQFKLKALANKDNLNLDAQAVRFFNSLFKSKKDKPYVLLFIKYLYNFYLDYQKRKKTPKSCAVYVDNIKIVFVRKEDPFYDFKSNIATQLYCPNKKTILLQTICSCRRKKMSRFEFFERKIETKVKIFNSANHIAFLFVFDVNKYRGSRNTNYVVIELYIVDKNTLKTLFLRNIFYDKTKKNQILESDLRHVFTLLPSKNFKMVSSNREEHKGLFSKTPDSSINKWTVLETIDVGNSKNLTFIL